MEEHQSNDTNNSNQNTPTYLPQQRYLSPSSSISESDSDCETQFHLFYTNLLDHYEKQHYRKLLKTIEHNPSYEISHHYWKVVHLKIKCLQKILERKMIKYVDDKSIPSFTTWLKRYDQEIFIWLHNLTLLTPSIDKYYYEKLELIITWTLNQCYNYAVFCLKQSNICDCLGFLSLGERLIKHTSDFFISPESMYYASQILLFLSSLYISDNNFDSAKSYVIAMLKLSYKELEMRIKSDLHYLIMLDESYTNEEKESIYNVFFNITIGFFHLGVCYEHELELEKSYQAYQQAKWFGKNTKMNKVSTFTDILYDIEERSRIRYELIEFFHKEEANLKDTPPRKKKKQIYSYNEELKMKKFEKIQKFVEGIKLTDIDDDEKDLLNHVQGKPFSNKVGNITKTIHVLNYLMSEQFRNVIDNMQNIEIHKPNKETERIIQKKIIQLKNTERMKLHKQHYINDTKDNQITQTYPTCPQISTDNSIYNTTSPNSINNNNNYIAYTTNVVTVPSTIYTTSRNSLAKSANHTQLYKHTNNFRDSSFNMKLLSSSNIHNNKHSNNNNAYTFNTSIITNQRNSYNSSKNITLNKCNKGNSTNTTYINNKPIKLSQIPQKIKYSPYVFNKSFRNKISFLDKQYTKELLFQKNLLHSKDNEHVLPFEPVNDRKINHQCDNFFETTLKKEMRLLKEKEHNTHKSELVKKTNMISQNMRKTFSTKSVELNKKKEKHDKMKFDSSEYTLKTNENTINMLQVELDSLEQTEKGLINKIKLVMKQRNGKKNVMKRKKIYLNSDNGGDYN